MSELELQVLPAWLDADAAALSGAVPPAATLAEALPGFAKARSLLPVQRLQRLQESTLAECGGAGEPIFLAWRQFLRGHGPSRVVIDATGFDVRARGSAAVLDGTPWRLAEGVLIALGLRESEHVELRLPAELNGHEAALLNAIDAICSLAQITVPRRRLEVQRDCRPSCWAEGQASDGSRLVHTPETWCRIALLFADASRPRCVAPDAQAWHEAARPGRARAFGEPPAPDRHLGGRRRGARRRPRPRVRRWPGRLPAAVARQTCPVIRCRSRPRVSSRRRPA